MGPSGFWDGPYYAYESLRELGLLPLPITVFEL